MKYTGKSHIESVKDVEAFFRHLAYERNLSFHPDDMFEDYVSCENRTLSLEECSVYDRLMDESFIVCRNEGADIYGIGHDIVQKAYGRQSVL